VSYCFDETTTSHSDVNSHPVNSPRPWHPKVAQTAAPSLDEASSSSSKQVFLLLGHCAIFRCRSTRHHMLPSVANLVLTLLYVHRGHWIQEIQSCMYMCLLYYDLSSASRASNELKIMHGYLRADGFWHGRTKTSLTGCKNSPLLSVRRHWTLARARDCALDNIFADTPTLPSHLTPSLDTRDAHAHKTRTPPLGLPREILFFGER